eukprot:TRINITY_DN1014_c0_g1_i6.p1 TRINITY_DN1014_c0_g1~~TRINITY_DN1014_c0_g1_i6.p1  ORF type:complete len:479 (+),score=91.30 TRINITY_DN1014_c0_g1_i6:1132-2568(+)
MSFCSGRLSARAIQPSIKAEVETGHHTNPTRPHCFRSWFISSLATLAATHPELINMRFLEANPELGYYVVCFWKDGSWKEVIVDDRLLVQGGKSRGYVETELVYASCFNKDDPTEPAQAVWVAIMEKAYAKLHGGYEALEGGHLSYGSVDLTGGCPMSVSKTQAHKTTSGLANMFEWEEDMFYYIRHEIQNRGILQLLGCSVHEDGIGPDGANEVGLIPGHEYSVIRVIRLQDKGLDYPLLVVLRNPWGKDGEFTGDWSDSSDRWTQTMQDLTNYNPKGREDGEFVMAFKDLQKYFTHFELTHLYSDSSFRSLIRSSWIGNTAAGCGNVGKTNRQDLYLNNPQFLLEVPPPPEEGMPCNLQFCAEQEDIVWTKTDDEFFQIQLRLFAIQPDEISYGRLEGFREDQCIETTGLHIPLRSVSLTVPNLAAGKYILIASTFEAHCESSLMLTTWASYPVHVCELGGEDQLVITGDDPLTPR